MTSKHQSLFLVQILSKNGSVENKQKSQKWPFQIG